MHKNKNTTHPQAHAKDLVKCPGAVGSLSALINFPGFSVCQVFLLLLCTASVEIIFDSETISSTFQNVFF